MKEFVLFNDFFIQHNASLEIPFYIGIGTIDYLKKITDNHEKQIMKNIKQLVVIPQKDLEFLYSPKSQCMKIQNAQHVG